MGKKKDEEEQRRHMQLEKFIDIELITLEGERKWLSEYVGHSKFLFIDFWASWCNPCRETNPEMVALYNEFNSQGLEIISISLDSDKSEWLEAIEEDGLLWPYHGSELKSRTNTIATIYNVKVIPTTYLLDAENKIIAINLKGESLKQKIKELMK